jgi:FtsZ-binding cell division protein ZapB
MNIQELIANLTALEQEVSTLKHNNNALQEQVSAIDHRINNLAVCDGPPTKKKRQTPNCKCNICSTQPHLPTSPSTG